MLHCEGDMFFYLILLVYVFASPGWAKLLENYNIVGWNLLLYIYIIINIVMGWYRY